MAPKAPLPPGRWPGPLWPCPAVSDWVPGAAEPGQDPRVLQLVCPPGDPRAAGARGTWVHAMTVPQNPSVALPEATLCRGVGLNSCPASGWRTEAAWGLPPVPLPCGCHPVAPAGSAWGQRSSLGLQSSQAQRRLAAACVTQSHLPPRTGRAGWLPCSGSEVPSGDPRVVSLQLVREGDSWVEAVDSPGLCWEGGELRGRLALGILGSLQALAALQGCSGRVSLAFE